MDRARLGSVILGNALPFPLLTGTPRHLAKWLCLCLFSLVGFFSGQRSSHAGDKQNWKCCLAGTLVDWTHNHGADRRICAPSLGIQRDVYVYLPPGYSPEKQYPLFIWLHGFGGDEKQFTRQVLCALDAAIVSGRLPPMIAVAPDGSFPTNAIRRWHSGSWFLNSDRGKWEDYLVRDIWSLAHENFSIRPEREAHLLAGWSMGGFSAYNLGFKHPDQFGMLIGIYPNLNLRFCNCHGCKWTKFEPGCEKKCTSLGLFEVMGFYPYSPLPVPTQFVFRPVWGSGTKAMERMRTESPVEMLDHCGVEPGQFQMLVAYGGKDEYHIDCQAASFVHNARCRGLDVWVRFNPKGHHHWSYVNECMPDVFTEAGKRLRCQLPDLEELAMPCACEVKEPTAPVALACDSTMSGSPVASPSPLDLLDLAPAIDPTSN